MDAEAKLQSFIDKFDDDNRMLIRSVRAALQVRLPSCAELIWDNYNFLVIGYSPTERPSDYIVSIAAAASGASLSFNNGADLPDPKRVLQGGSKVNRFIRLPTIATLSEPDVDEMIEIACRASDVPRPWNGGGKLVVRSVSAKQRPRRRSVNTRRLSSSSPKGDIQKPASGQTEVDICSPKPIRL